MVFQLFLYLQVPATNRNAMKRNKPVQIPARPNVGAATSMNKEDMNPTITYSKKNEN